MRKSPFLLGYLPAPSTGGLSSQSSESIVCGSGGLALWKLHGKEGSSLALGNLTQVSFLQTLFPEVLSGGQAMVTQLLSEKWKHQGSRRVRASPWPQTIWPIPVALNTVRPGKQGLMFECPSETYAQLENRTSPSGFRNVPPTSDGMTATKSMGM